MDNGSQSCGRLLSGEWRITVSLYRLPVVDFYDWSSKLHMYHLSTALIMRTNARLLSRGEKFDVIRLIGHMHIHLRIATIEFTRRHYRIRYPVTPGMFIPRDPSKTSTHQ